MLEETSVPGLFLCPVKSREVRGYPHVLLVFSLVAMHAGPVGGKDALLPWGYQPLSVPVHIRPAGHPFREVARLAICPACHAKSPAPPSQGERGFVRKRDASYPLDITLRTRMRWFG